MRAKFENIAIFNTHIAIIKKIEEAGVVILES